MNLVKKLLQWNSSMELESPEELVLEQVKLTGKVILFNDEWHTFDEVINQIIRATGCSLSRAEQLTLEVHHSGFAEVFQGEFQECLRVSAVLEEIDLRTEVKM